MSAIPERAVISEDLQDLSGLTIEPVLADPEKIPEMLKRFDTLLALKYEQLIIHGFKRRLTSKEIHNHPLILLLHDFRHLLCHGNRGDRATRAKKEKTEDGVAYENSYCRIGVCYLPTQDQTTFDLKIRFAISVEPQPVLTSYDGTVIRQMTNGEIADVVTRYTEDYITEARAMIGGNVTNCDIDVVNVLEGETEGEGEGES